MPKSFSDSRFRILYEELRGWLTLDVLERRNSRDIVLFADHYAARLLNLDQRKILTVLRQEIQGRQSGGLGVTGATKHVVNEMFAGEAGLFNPNHNFTVAVYRFGPVPALIFGESNGLRLGVYPRIGGTSSSDEEPYPSDLYNRLLSYRNAGVGTLFRHYLEHVAARLTDLRTLRAPATVAKECQRIEREIQDSIFGKLTDIKLPLKKRTDPLALRIASEMHASFSHELHLARFSAYFALHLIADHLKFFGVSDRGLDHGSRISKRSWPSADDSELEHVKQLWLAYEARDESWIRRLRDDSATDWVQEFASFALYNVRKLDFMQRCGRRWWTPRIFPSFQFDVKSAPAARALVARLPGQLGEDATLLPGIVPLGEVIDDDIRLRIRCADLVMPVICDSDSHESDRYDYVIQEIEEAALLERSTLIALQDGKKEELVDLRQLVTQRQFDWFTKDPRITADRKARVLRELGRRAAVFHDSGPDTGDSEFVNELLDRGHRQAQDRARALVELCFSRMDTETEHWSAAATLATLDDPKTTGELLGVLQEQKIVAGEADFRRVRAKHNSVGVILPGAGPKNKDGTDRTFKLVEYSQQTKRYVSNLGPILSAHGLRDDYPDARERALAAIVGDIRRHLPKTGFEPGYAA